MKRLFFFLLIAVVMGSQPLRAQQQDAQNYAAVLHQRGEVFFKFAFPGRQQISQLNKYLSMDHLRGDTVYAYANARGFASFLRTAIPFVLLTPPSMRQTRQQLAPKGFKSGHAWDSYPSYGQYVTLMQGFQKGYPKLCRIISIGKSVQGRALLFAHLGHQDTARPALPVFMYTSTMHGDETTGYILMLHLIDYLLSNYGREATITHLLDSVDIWINPLANPDGTYAGGDTSVYGATRFNANHIDLNRNYPDPNTGEHPDGNAWQPETKAFMAFAEAHPFVLSCNMHTGSEVANYPWDTWSFRTADDAWWQQVCRQYADTVHAYARAGYLTALDNGITNGYDWYSITGGRQDYMNYFRHDREFTLELSYNKMPPADSLPKYWDYNYRSLVQYIHQVLKGLRGTVTDSVTGRKLKAEVFAVNHDNHHSEVFSDSVTGCYFRPIYPGVYDFRYSAAGYKTKTIRNVQIKNGKPLVLNVQLAPEHTSGIGEQNRNRIGIYPNPVTDELFCTGCTTDSKAVVMALSGKILFSGNIRPGKPLHVGPLPQGVYLLKIVSGRKISFFKFIRK